MPELRTAAESSLPFHTQEGLRFGDQDVQGHVNNSVYSTLFECSRVSFQTNPNSLFLAPGQRVVLVAIAIDFVAELHWPATVDITLGVAKFGRSSFGFAEEIWLGNVLVARARSTQVVINEKSRKSMALTQAQRELLSKWLVEHKIH